MSLHDTDGYIAEAATATESLPDPTTVNGRTHLLVNTGTATAVWSSVGATPFQQGGVNVATVSVARGQALQVQSDGTRWVAKSSGTRPIFAGTGVTNASGDVVFAFPAGLFAAAPVVDVAYQGAGSPSPVDFRITALSATSCTVNVRQSLATVVALIGLTILAASTPLNGATVHVIATPAGATP
ncbi:hypothetical protein [Embleya sp. NPDC001921]